MEMVQRTHKKKRWKYSNMIHTGTWSLHNHWKYSTLIYNFCHVCQSQYRVSIDSPSVVVGLDLHLSRIHNEVVCVQLNPWKKYLLQALHVTADCIVTKGTFNWLAEQSSNNQNKSPDMGIAFSISFPLKWPLCVPSQYTEYLTQH